MSEFTRNLIKDLSELLENSDEYNISIIAGENGNTEKFQAHSLILRARSRYFRRALSKNWAKKRFLSFHGALSKGRTKKEGEMMVFKIPNISPQIFELILKYLYTSMIDLNKESGHDVLSLLVAADELEIHELIHHAQDNLITKKLTWIQQNLVKIMHTVSLHKSFKRLNEHFLKTINKEPHMIFKSNDFLSLEESVLVSLLERDDLIMDEIEIWNSIIKWGTGNTLNLPNQPVSNWKPQNFVVLEKTLRQCIPLIRYSDISSNDYFEKVVPYRKIIPKDMKMEILGYYLSNLTPQPIKLLPPRSGPIDSNNINFTHIKLISSWIDKKDSTSSSNKFYKPRYEFNLFYRGNRAGFDATKFRALSGSRMGIVVVVKINQTGKIIGCYIPSEWDEEIGSNLNIPDAFTFSFGDRSDLQSAKISRNNSGSQIACNLYQANDSLYFFTSNKCNELSWYYDTRENLNFRVDEYEIFQISKKKIV
ncbi:10598_t:CDS:2 [Ambispora gerdemannii]|uniref:10598_t:CDS:1 n=1 Tax=Ambispora gerdemannii TaxID=144530 RepID=A0A9N9CU92_9GLOM|nr:10598_t:CDS:2 [Ambispora gerdemannii]